MDHPPARMTVAELDAFLRVEMPQLFRHASIAIEHADGKTCRVREAYNDGMLRPGDTISGPTLMALADLAMWVVLLSAIGPVGLVSDDQSQHQFPQQGAGGTRRDRARRGCMKLGKRLAVGEVTLYSAAGS